jgi:cellulose biosynthesis protein BcsQ
MKKYVFWNNKGGTGKTSLAFQAICRYANKHAGERILAVDVCPQANLSELFLGGLTRNGSNNLLQREGMIPRCTIGGYFQARLPSPYTSPVFSARDFITTPSNYNDSIPTNIDLICGDPLLELQSNAINTLANTQIPGTNTWIAIIDWLSDFINQLNQEYSVIFMDCNPSFSIYTQIAISTTDLLILPVMADDSSRRAIQNAFSLVYGLKLPSPIYSSYAFSAKLSAANRQLPKVHLIVKNRITQYMGPASAYAAVLKSIESDVQGLLTTNPNMFSFSNMVNGLIEVRDFQTSGVVAFAKGSPFYELTAGRLMIGGHRVQVKEEYTQNCIKAIDGLIATL